MRIGGVIAFITVAKALILVVLIKWALRGCYQVFFKDVVILSPFFLTTLSKRRLMGYSTLCNRSLFSISLMIACVFIGLSFPNICDFSPGYFNWCCSSSKASRCTNLPVLLSLIHWHRSWAYCCIGSFDSKLIGTKCIILWAHRLIIILLCIKPAAVLILEIIIYIIYSTWRAVLVICYVL